MRLPVALSALLLAILPLFFPLPVAAAYEEMDLNKIHSAIKQHCLKDADLIAKIGACLDFYRDNLALHIAVKNDDQRWAQYRECSDAVIKRESDRDKRDKPIKRCEADAYDAAAARFLQDPRTPFDKQAETNAGCWELWGTLYKMTEDLEDFVRRDSFGLAASKEKGCAFLASLAAYRTGNQPQWVESDCSYGKDTASFRRCLAREIDPKSLSEEIRICRENKTWQDEYNLPEPPPYTNPYQSSWLAAANYEASKKFLMARDLRRNRWSCEILEALGKEMSLETATAKKLPIVPAHVPGELAPNERDVAMAMGNLQEFMIRAGIASQNLLVPYVSSVRDDCNLSAPGGCTIRALGSEMTLEIAYVAIRGCAPAPNGASGVDCDFTMKLSCQAADDRTGILCATLGAPNVFDSINFVRQPGGWVARFRG